MTPTTFTYEPLGTEVVVGRGAVAGLGDLLDQRSRSRALVVCGRHVGANAHVMDRLAAALGDRLVGTFPGTDPRKPAASVFAGIEMMRELGADVLIGVGGGSSLDTARQMTVFDAAGRPLPGYVEEARRNGKVAAPSPADDGTPVVVVPTTLAGADLASGGTIEFLPAAESPTGLPVRAGARIAPWAAVYDPDLFDATPRRALLGSAMNGFDKGLETIYSRDATPRSDATAMRGIGLLLRALPQLADGDPEQMDRAVEGIVLVQLYLRLSLIHAIGHGFTRQFPVQQGMIHAVVAPYGLRFVADRLGPRRTLLAEALDLRPVEGRDVPAERIVERVAELRDALRLPTRLRELVAEDAFDLDKTVRYVMADPLLRALPPELEPTQATIERLIHAAW